MLTKSEHNSESAKRSEHIKEWNPIEWYNYHRTALGIVYDILEYLKFRDYDCVVEKGFLLFGHRDLKIRYNKEQPFISICVAVLNTFDDLGKYLYDAGEESIDFGNNDGRVVSCSTWFSSAYYTKDGLEVVEGGHLPETVNYKIVKFYIEGYGDLDFGIEFYRYVNDISSKNVIQTYNGNMSVTFPRSIYEDRGRINLCGMDFPTIQNPEKWLEIYYGSNWNIPIDEPTWEKKAHQF